MSKEEAARGDILLYNIGHAGRPSAGSMSASWSWGTWLRSRAEHKICRRCLHRWNEVEIVYGKGDVDLLAGSEHRHKQRIGMGIRIGIAKSMA